jgi:hypothetical protein
MDGVGRKIGKNASGRTINRLSPYLPCAGGRAVALQREYRAFRVVSRLPTRLHFLSKCFVFASSVPARRLRRMYTA